MASNRLAYPVAGYHSVAGLLILLVTLGLAADDDLQRVRGASGNSDRFVMVRVQYDSSGGYGEAWYAYEGRIWQRWETDYPRAELNFLHRLTELTSIPTASDPISLKLTDPAIYNYPFLFMSDVGWQVLSKKEKANLRRHLRNGGFLWVDDFWGSAEWRNFARISQDAFPDWEWRDIPDDHALLNIVYSLDRCPQVPARFFFETTGLSYDPFWSHRRPNGGDADLSQVHFKGLFDKGGRLLAVATHNTDIADGWEREGEDQEYFERFSVHTYALGINILMYALTH
ncbi:MAG: hypothetical protein M2R45_04966 [Verrucomicrobia subdivision 3 bacterium]|nr:hypothetical protein [Limisphaerales bacterium]MCS1414087.1 hypothetical protein [Limisphaerales bacterium]